MTGEAIITPFLAAAAASAADQFIRSPSFVEQLIDELSSPGMWILSAMGVLLAASALCGPGKARFIFGALGWGLPLVLSLAAGVMPASFAFWMTILLTINLVQLLRTTMRTRRGLMSGEEYALIAEVLSIEEPAKQRRLRDVLTWRDAETGEILIRQGEVAPSLIYIATGKMDIEHDGLPVGTCGPDDFIGEMSLVSGDGASATVKVSMPARIAVFDREGLQRLVQAMPELSRALDRTLNRGLSAKIQRMNKATRESWNFRG
ncbi:cyclic nucleotide-binding domain-containing protein [Altererythrobacter sp. KTW20L]|uniref:Crp/Fnr family transcriptional regulator n=1 Tax=Altererythrobacter sp. KTW20L TaxID=2942210 RepID=UPI0020C07BFD|nr:cyclic nucleotide-binding domain-containing protein [Altererythrobacter sp. KTW20L]MCL6251289.1 cyclic nucleotide-binding domain-containing protein [Altererythrobacter sp. KTW20L]